MLTSTSHLFNKYTSSILCVLRTVLGTGDTIVSETSLPSGSQLRNKEVGKDNIVPIELQKYSTKRGYLYCLRE